MDPFVFDRTQMDPESTPIVQPGISLTLTKPGYETCFVIEPEYSQENDPLTIVEKYFPPNWHFIPSDPKKNRQFYELILIDTMSIMLTHIFNPNDPSNFSHSKCTIKKVITLQEWGEHPSKLWEFSTPFEPQFFNYWDYKKAWFNTFYLQNKQLDHCWLLNFDKSPTDQLPNWFLNWWILFGPIKEILPKPIKHAFKKFERNYQVPTQMSSFPSLLHLYTNYQLPWILHWDYMILQGSPFKKLARRFKVTWWDQFEFDEIVNEIKSPNVHFKYLIVKAEVESELLQASSKKEIKRILLNAISRLS
ncbi:uncharacterized protein LOC115950902 [Quercus lobata]|nr:uncharacterized protein LOC115950902 [Quercus lobata]